MTLRHSRQFVAAFGDATAAFCLVGNARQGALRKIRSRYPEVLGSVAQFGVEPSLFLPGFGKQISPKVLPIMG
jgi:hypothetical protein